MRLRVPIVGALAIGLALSWAALQPRSHSSTVNDYRFGYDSARAFVDVAHYTHRPLHGPVHDCQVMLRIAKPLDRSTFTQGCWNGYGHEVAIFAGALSA